MNKNWTDWKKFPNLQFVIICFVGFFMDGLITMPFWHSMALAAIMAVFMTTWTMGTLQIMKRLSKKKSQAKIEEEKACIVLFLCSFPWMWCLKDFVLHYFYSENGPYKGIIIAVVALSIGLIDGLILRWQKKKRKASES